MDDISRKTLEQYKKARETKRHSIEYFTPCISCDKPLIRDRSGMALFGFVHAHSGLEECEPRYASPNYDKLVKLDGTVVWNVHDVVFNMNRKESGTDHVS